MRDVARKIYCLFSPRERRRIILLMVAIILMGLMQTVSVAAVLPFLSVLSDPSVVQSNAVLRWLYATFGFSDQQTYLFFIGFAVLAVLIIANTLSAFTVWATSRFSWSNQYRLSQRLLERYLAWPYIAFLTRNTSDLRKNFLFESTVFTTGVLLPVINALSYGFTAFCILGFLVWLNPVLALVAVAVLGGAFGVVFLVVRRRLDHAGRMRIKANSQRFKAAAEAFGGIKEVKVLGREPNFLAQFSAPARAFAQANTTREVVSQVPRHALEIIAFGGVLVIVLILMAIEGNVQQIIPIAGVYAFAALRLMPALQNIYQAASTIRFNHVVVDTLYDHLMNDLLVGSRPGDIKRAPGEGLSFKEAIRLRNISLTYPNAAEPAVKDVGITIPHQHKVALVGPTGSGKTTLVDIVLGLLEPQEGTLAVDGVPIEADNLACWQSMLGYVPQFIYLADDTIRRNIAYGIAPVDINPAAVERAARMANLHDFITRLPRGYDTVVGERGIALSGGQRQRVGIARALYHDPEVLILDEATSALDNETEHLVLAEIEQVAATKTVVMIAHRLTTVQDCDAIYVLEKGRVVAQGTYDELLAGNIYFRRLAQV